MRQEGLEREDGAAGHNRPPRLRIRELRSPYAGPFSLDLAGGECVAILGASGSGKTVFLRMIADLDPSSGIVLLGGAQRESWAAPAWRRKVIYQAAEPAWWETTAAAHFSPEEKETIMPLLARLNLRAELLDNELARLSTGERQRLALLRSLSRAPDVLLLDEPTAALDQESTAAVEALLRDCKAQGLALLLVTHSHEQARRLGDRLFRMHHGALEPA